MGQIYDPRSRDWKSVERDSAEEVRSHLLLPLEQGGKTRLAITRIEAGGTFGPHIDDYAHVFCVLEGHGRVTVGKDGRDVSPGDVILTDVKEPHGLWASDDEALVLVAANIYE